MEALSCRRLCPGGKRPLHLLSARTGAVPVCVGVNVCRCFVLFVRHFEMLVL